MSESRYIQLLGTGAGDANFGRPDSAQLPTRDIRRYTCNTLSPDILIDFNHQTPGALEEFGIDRDAIRHLFVSHGHFDHFQPVEILSFAESLPQPLVVYGNTMVRDALEFCRDNTFDRNSGRFVAKQTPFNIEVNVIVPGMVVKAGNASVTALPANHFMNQPYCIMEQQALNFLIEVGGKTIFYGLDSSYLLPGALERLSGSRFDIAILDATFGPREIDPMKSGHLNWKMLDETIAELREAGCIDDATVIVAAHLSTNNVEPNNEVAEKLARRGITLSYDGLKLQL